MEAKHTIIDGILDGDFDEELEEIREALGIRQQILDRKKARTIKPGDRVMLNRRCKPKYLQGSIGTVGTMKKGSKFEVTLDSGQEIGRYSGIIYCPSSILDKI